MTEVVEKGLKRFGVTISKPVLAILCLIFGIVVIAWQQSLNYVVGIFFIIEGILLLTDYMELQRQQKQQPPAQSSQ